MNTYLIPKEGRTRQEYLDYCTGLPWIFADGVTRCLYPDYSLEQVAAEGTLAGFTLLDAVPVSSVVVPISKLAFLDRFTDAELAAILTAAKTVVQIEVFVKKLDAASDIILSDARTQLGVQALEAFGLIAEGRAAQILGA